MKKQNLEINFYTHSRYKKEDNPRGVLAASFTCLVHGEQEEHYTGDIRVRDTYVLLGFSGRTFNGLLKSSIQDCLESEIYGTVTGEFDCDVTYGYPHFLSIDKSDIDLWEK